MSRAINVFKMRGSWHDKGIREYTITERGPQIKDSFRGYERIISGSPTRITINEKSELSRILQGVQGQDDEDIWELAAILHYKVGWVELGNPTFLIWGVCEHL